MRKPHFLCTMSAVNTGSVGGVKKQNRPSMVCSNCRRRKIKCDKKMPCTRCKISKIEDTCSYGLPLTASNSTDTRYSDESTYSYDGSPRYVENARHSSKLFNQKTNELKMPLFSKAEGKSIEYHSPLTLEAMFGSNTKYTKFKSMVPSMFTDKSIDEKSSKVRQAAKQELIALSGEYSKEEIDSCIRKFFLPNMNAINERLAEYERQIKNGSLMSFIPLQRSFDHLNEMIIPDPLIPGEFIYNEPGELEHYNTFGIVAATLRMISIVVEFDDSLHFHYNYNLSVDTMSHFSLKIASFTDYKNKPTFQSLIILLINRMCHFVLDLSGNDSNNSVYSIIIVEMIFRLGIHIRVDHMYGYSEEEVRAVWNVIQFIDSYTSVLTGEPLKIDHSICVPRLYDFWEPVILFFRKLSITFMSVNPISLNQLICLADSASCLLTTFKPFEEILNNEDSGPAKFGFTVIVKSEFITVSQILLLNIRLSLDDVDKISNDISERDRELVEEIKLKCECQLFYLLTITFKLIKKIVNGEFTHAEQSSRLTVVMRSLFSFFMQVGNRLIFYHLAVFSKTHFQAADSVPPPDKDDDNEIMPGSFDDISIEDAEKCIGMELDQISSNDMHFKRMMKLKTSLVCLSDFLNEFYVSVSNKSPPLLVGNFSIHFKFLLLICTILKNIHEHKKEQLRMNPSYTLTKKEWSKIINKTMTTLGNQNQRIDDVIEDECSASRSMFSDFNILDSEDLRNQFLLDDDLDGGIGESSIYHFFLD